jgi:hypothetical protein
LNGRFLRLCGIWVHAYENVCLLEGSCLRTYYHRGREDQRRSEPDDGSLGRRRMTGMGRTKPPYRWLAITAGVIAITGVLSRDPIVDALSGESVPEVGLVFTPMYLLFAPVLGTLDHLSLLTDRQHVAVLSVLVLGFLSWRGLCRVTGRSASLGFGRECLLALLAFVALLAFYGFGVLGVRPMAALRSQDPDLVIVDFHSHTDSSHDGRPGFDIGARRAWHRGAGFDLAYLTDHVDLHPATTTDNPGVAGGGLSLLPGREVRFREQHVLVLGQQDPTGEIPAGEPWPVLIQTLPNDLSRVPKPSAGGDWGGVQAIELVDADPRGLRQGVEERELIMAIADSLDLALVAGSNHHGWGRTAAAWTLVHVPNWRDQPPAQVGRDIEALILRDRGKATRVVERRRLGNRMGTEPLLAEVLTLPRLVWHILRSLTLPERLAWLGWIATGAILLPRVRRRTELTSA